MKLKALLPLLILSFALSPFAVLAQSPIAAMNASVNAGCSPLSVSFNNLSTGSVSYIWDFGNGSTSSINNPTVVYLTPGSYTVKLIATSSAGVTDTLTMSNYIEVLQDPIAAYSVSQVGSCANNNLVSFNNTSANSSDYLWDFGDGGSSTLASPTHTYTDDGSYTVTLIASNAVGCTDVKQMLNVAVINPLPDVEFIVDQNFSCDSNTVYQFDNVTSGATVSIWNFGDGSSASTASPSHNYGISGIFDVTLITMNSLGCIDTLTKPGIIENFGSSSISFWWEEVTGGNGDSVICPEDELQFYVDSAVDAISYSWDFGNGITDTSAFPVVQYSAPGLFDVRLQVVNALGCLAELTMTNFVTVAELPVADVTPSTDTACAGDLIAFTNNSINTASHWWVFNAGSPGVSISSQAEPSRIYANQGSIVTEYYAMSSLGCKDKMYVPITINGHETDFSVDETLGCAPFEANFTELGSGSVAWDWDFGDGNMSNVQNPTNTYLGNGQFGVTLVSTGSNGCKDTVVVASLVDVTADTLNITLSDTVSGCLPYPVDFSNNIIGSNNWHWDFGDGTTSNLPNPTHIYTTGGNYTVTLTTQTSNGCSMFIENYATFFLEDFSAGFNAYSLECEYLSVYLVDTATSSTAVSWYWNFGDGSASTDSAVVHVYSDTTSYNISLTVTSASGCVSTILVNNFVNFEDCTIMGAAIPDIIESPPPMSGSGSSVLIPVDTNALICAPVSVYFYSPFADATSWNWDLGDGTYSTDEHVFHYYTEAGIYDVKMIAQSPAGPDTLILNGYVDISGPKANFTAVVDYDCVDNSVQFTDLSLDADTYLWNFGDGSTSIIASPSHQYLTNDVIIPVTLRVTDTSGCYSLFGSMLSILEYDPEVLFEDTICLGQEVFLAPVDTVNYTYSWNFGDGSTSNAQFPSHEYASPGAYEVTFEASHVLGCVQSYTLDSVYVIGFDQDFTISDSVLGCVNDTLSFIPSIANASAYEWIIPGSGVSFMASTGPGSTFPVVVFRDSGLFSVDLVTRIGQCLDTVRKSDVIEIFEVSAKFTVEQLDYCDPYLLELNSSSVNAEVHTWNYMGVTAVDSSTIQLSAPADSTEFSLLVTNQFGCVDTDTVAFVPEQLTVGFSSTGTTGCTPHEVIFTNESENAASWFWDFGDGNTSTLENPTHSYSVSGSFDVMLIIEPASGNCQDTLFYPNYISTSSPMAEFNFDGNYSCAPMIVEFTDSSSDAISWNWDFGDGSNSILPNPLHVYNFPGNYDVALTVTDVNGCSHTKTNLNAVFVPGPIGDFSVSQSYFCDSGEVQFTDLSTGASTWSWTFGDGNSSTMQHPTHMFSSNGSYTIALIVEDTAGCITSVVMDTLITVYETPKAEFVVNDSIGCLPHDVTMTDFTIGADAWVWDMGDSNQYYSLPTFHTYNAQGSYEVSLIVSVAGMCYDTAYKDVLVLDFADATVDPVADMCQQSMWVTLSAAQSGGLWSGPGITSSTMGTFDPNAAGAGTHTIVYTLPGSCSSSDSVQINVLPNIDAVIDSVDVICLEQGQLNIPVANTGGEWSGIGIIDITTGLFDPSVSGVGNFMLTYTTSNGICSDADSVLVSVTAEADATITPIAALCEQGGSVTLTAAQYGGVWTGSGITNASSGSFDPLVAGPGNHTVVYSIPGVCSDADSILITVYEFIEASVTPEPSICQSQAAFGLTSLNAGGVWTGLGIVDSVSGTFDPLASGIGTFTITYSTQNGLCTDQDSMQVQVVADADASFASIGPLCENGSSQLIVPSVSGGLWSGSGITNSSSGLFDPAVAGVGVHQITYAIAGLCGDTVSNNIEVTLTPDVNISSSATNGCSSIEVSFNGNSSVPGTYSWDFGNGMTSELVNPQITFGPGQFSVQLTVTSSNGCSDSVLIQNLVTVMDSIPTIPVIRRVSVMSDTSVVLDWEESADPSFSGYKIYRKSLVTGIFEEIKFIELSGITSYVDNGLNTLENVYCYKITEVDVCGNEITTTEATDHCTINLSAETVGIHHVDVSWTHYSGCSVGSYELFRYQEQDTTGVFIASLPSTDTAYTDTSVYCKMGYSYRVFASGLCGNPIVSWSDTEAIRAEGISDKQISNVIRATVVDDQSVWVEWTIPEVGSGYVDYYQILRSNDGTDFMPIGMVPDGVNGLNDESVDVFNERYFYKIQIVNGCPESNVAGTQGTSILLKSTKISENQGSLEWTPYKGWKDGVDYYEIQVLNEFNQWETIKIVKGSILQTIVSF